MARERLVTIGVAARLLGIPAWRLRAWERSGFLATERTGSGYRLYSPRDLEKARAIAAELDGADRLASLGLAHGGAPEPTGDPQPRALPEPDREHEILRRLGHAVRHTQDPLAVARLGLESALELTGSVVGALSSADFTRQQYVLLSSVGLSQRYTRGVDSWKLHEGLAGRAFGLREPILIPDLQVDRDVAREFVRAEGLRAYLCVPLLRGERRLGILEVFSRSAGRFDRADIDALELVAAAIAPVLELAEQARHLQSLQDERARVLREWSNQLTGGLDRERTQIAARLNVIAASLDAGLPAERGADMIRRAAEGLAAGGGGQIELLPLVRANVVQRLSELHGVQVTLAHDDWPATLPSVLTSRLYLVVLAVAEEAAAAARARVELSFAGGPELTVTIADDREAQPGVEAAAISADITSAARNLGARLRSGVRPGSALVETTIVVPRGELDARGDTLTLREREVLEALRLGATNREIASELSISAKTLQNHLTALYRKLDITSRAEAIRYADRTARGSAEDPV